MSPDSQVAITSSSECSLLYPQVIIVLQKLVDCEMISLTQIFWSFLINPLPPSLPPISLLCGFVPCTLSLPLGLEEPEILRADTLPLLHVSLSVGMCMCMSMCVPLHMHLSFLGCLPHCFIRHLPSGVGWPSNETQGANFLLLGAGVLGIELTSSCLQASTLRLSYFPNLYRCLFKGSGTEFLFAFTMNKICCTPQNHERKKQALCPNPHCSKGAGSRFSKPHPAPLATLRMQLTFLGCGLPLILSPRSLAVLFGYEKEPAMLMNYLNLSSTQLCKSDYLFKGSLAWNSL